MPNTELPHLTDFTQVKLLANGFVAIFEGTAKATLVAPKDQGQCGEQYEGYPINCDPEWYPDFPGDLIQTCTAPAVEFDNGFACVHGHDHFTDAEYYTEEEAHHIIQAGHPLAPNARII